jgi:uncharacterized protein
MAFVATNKMPGVYIDEVQLPGPIAGVATNIVGIVGPAERGPSNKPVLVTNSTEFAVTFGGFITSPNPKFAAHAVHGFFANGGTLCYFVRIGPAKAAWRDLLDGAGKATLRVAAKADGVAGNSITTSVAHTNLYETKPKKESVALAAPGASGRQAKVAANRDFRPGDVVVVSEGATSEQATVESVGELVINFRQNLANVYTAAGAVNLGPLKSQQRRIRVDNVANIEPGSYVEIRDGANNEKHVVDIVNKSNGWIMLRKGLANDYADPDNTEVKSIEFSLTVGSEKFEGLSMDPRHSRYVVRAVKSDVFEVLIPSEPANPTAAPGDLPVVLANQALGGGTDDVADHTDAHFAAGIDALEVVDEVSMICVPDAWKREIQQYMLDHCEKMQDRFAILDSAAGADVTAIRAQREALQTDRGYGALYYPRIRISDPDPLFDRLITVPASGHIAGVYARTDEQKGVHKAPANEALRRVVELERLLTPVQSGLLNEQSVNTLQFFRNRGFRVWGGRTLATSTQWRYVNVRRLMLFIEESVQEACEQFVFDPNNLSLWETIKRQVSGFLTTVWQSGALFGATPADAFRVRIDEELNPPETRALGELHIEVIVFPTTPAEFIVFHVIQEPGGPRLIEL